MMGASASAGWGGAAIYTDLVAGVERARRGYGVARVEKGGARVLQSGPKTRTAWRTREPFHDLVPVVFPIYFSKGKS